MVAHSEKEQSSMAVRKPCTKHAGVLCGVHQGRNDGKNQEQNLPTFLANKAQISNRISFGMK